jgi:hypothetical protein
MAVAKMDFGNRIKKGCRNSGSPVKLNFGVTLFSKLFLFSASF